MKWLQRKSKILKLLEESFLYVYIARSLSLSISFSLSLSRFCRPGFASQKQTWDDFGNTNSLPWMYHGELWMYDGKNCTLLHRTRPTITVASYLSTDGKPFLRSGLCGEVLNFLACTYLELSDRRSSFSIDANNKWITNVDHYYWLMPISSLRSFKRFDVGGPSRGVAAGKPGGIAMQRTSNV
jgi:hypothetical protein